MEVVDDDLGRSGGGIARPGFERLLAAICEARVGAVFAIEASTLKVRFPALLGNDIDHSHRRWVDQHNSVLHHGVLHAFRLRRGSECVVGQKVKLDHGWHLRSDHHRNTSWRLDLPFGWSHRIENSVLLLWCEFKLRRWSDGTPARINGRRLISAADSKLRGRLPNQSNQRNSDHYTASTSHS